MLQATRQHRAPHLKAVHISVKGIQVRLDPEVTSLSVDRWENGHLQVASLTPGHSHARKVQFISPKKHQAKKKLLEETRSLWGAASPATLRGPTCQPGAVLATDQRPGQPGLQVSHTCRAMASNAAPSGPARAPPARAGPEGPEGSGRETAPGGPQRGLRASPQHPHGRPRSPSPRNAAQHSHIGTERAPAPPPGPVPRLLPEPCPLPQRGAAASPTRQRRDALRCLSGSSSSPAPGRQGAVPGASAPRPAGSRQAPHEHAPRPRSFLRRAAAAQPGRGSTARSTPHAEPLQQHRVRKELLREYAVSARVNRGFYWLEKCDVAVPSYIRGARRPLTVSLK